MKKIIGYLIILALLAGSICGITYGIKYAVLSNQTDPEYTNELENKVSDYQEQMNTYYLTILDLQSQINELKLQGTTDSATISSLETTVTSLNNTIDSLTATNTSNETTIAENEETIASLKVEIFQLESDNSDKESEINSLNAQIAELEEANAQLEEDLDVNATTIAENNATITELKAEIVSLESQLTDKANEITVLNNTISSLETQNASLQKTNDSNLTLITSLNSQIVTLNEQIATLTSQITGNNDTVTKLNTEIAKLQQTISYYETYIASLETDEQAAVTFMFNGSVYSIQIVTKGTTASIADPTSTAYIVFNGWTVDGQAVNLDEYTITETTVFTADITTYYDVTFVSNSTTISTQIVEENTTATLPTAPTLTGYEFDGWSLDGVNVIEVSEYEITGTTTFTAKFTALHTVSFLYEDSEIDSQTIRDGEYASAPTVESTEYKTFNGWLLNDAIVNVSAYPIVADVVFTADITYSYDVLFVVDTETYDTQIVVSGSCATTPTSPSFTGYDFDGWSINGVDVVDVNSYEITHYTEFVAVFTALHTVSFIYEDSEIDSQIIRDGKYAIAPTVTSTAYKTFNDWLLNGETVDVSTYAIVADTVFVADITYSYAVTFIANDETYDTQIIESGSYATTSTDPTIDGYSFEGWTTDSETVVDVSTYTITEDTIFISLFVSNTYDTWSEMTWTGLTSFNGYRVWTDGVDYYYSYFGYQYVLDKSTLTWSEMTWSGLTSFDGYCIWSDGIDYYYSESSSQYVLDVENHVWNEMAWTGLTSFDGYNVSFFGDFCYFATGNLSLPYYYILDIDSHTWTEITWNYSVYYSSSVWTDGEDIYYSYSTNQYVLDKSTLTWSEMTWTGLTSFDGKYVWTDGAYIYYSNSDSQYILDVENHTWTEMIWNGYTTPNVVDFLSPYMNIWTDGMSFYYSKGTNQYVLTKSYCN